MVLARHRQIVRPFERLQSPLIAERTSSFPPCSLAFLCLQVDAVRTTHDPSAVDAVQLLVNGRHKSRWVRAYCVLGVKGVSFNLSGQIHTRSDARLARQWFFLLDSYALFDAVGHLEAWRALVVPEVGIVHICYFWRRSLFIRTACFATRAHFESRPTLLAPVNVEVRRIEIHCRFWLVDFRFILSLNRTACFAPRAHLPSRTALPVPEIGIREHVF